MYRQPITACKVEKYVRDIMKQSNLPIRIHMLQDLKTITPRQSLPYVQSLIKKYKDKLI